MKSLVTIFLFNFSLLLNAQKIEFISIDSTIKGTKDELFLRAKSWLVQTFKSANEVIQLNDKEAGKLIGKGNFKYDAKGSFGMTYDIDHIYFTVTINVKDNKDRIIITDFYHEAGTPRKYVSYGSLDNEREPKGMNYIRKQYERMKIATNEQGEELIKSFNTYMNSNSKIIKDEF